MCHFLVLGLLAIVSYSALALAGAIQICPTTGVCYSVAVPESSAQSGSGDIYFQIHAPTTYTWVALGTGTGMAGSNMFIMYQDGTGNVTMSPRFGTEYVMPTEDTKSDAAKLTLLAGSGVSGDTMTANVRCSNCNSWQGGTLSLASSTTSWIAAWKTGSSLATTDKNAVITQHDDTSRFTLDLTRATITEDANPFLDNTRSGGGSGGSTVTPTQGSSQTATVPPDASVTAGSTATASASAGASSGIRTGAKAGIGTVAAVGVMVVLAGLGFWVF